MTRQIAIFGGTGFVGRHLATRLAAEGITTRLAVHRTMPDWLPPAASATFVPCPLDDREAIAGLLDGATQVLNLLRPDGTGDRLRTLQALLPQIGEAAPERLLHFGSIDVYGDTDARRIDEETPARPATDYAREQLAIEQVMLTLPMTTIVRLAAVYGDGGANVVAFASEARRASLLRLALRRFAYGQRRMHLVSVHAVVDGIMELLHAPSLPRLVLLGQDGDERNTFAFMQDNLLAAHGRPPLDWMPTLPLPWLETALRLRHRPYREVRRRYLSTHPSLSGSKRDFAADLRAYATLLAAMDDR